MIQNTCAKMAITLWRLGLTVLGFFVATQMPLGALPPEFDFHDAEVTARGNAGVASGTGAAAVYYNPAALTRIGTPYPELDGKAPLEGGPNSDFAMTFYGLYLDIEANTPGRVFDLDTEYLLASSIFAASQIGNRPLYAGFGLYAPFGQQTDWGDPNPNRAFATDNRLMHFAATFSLGWRVSDSLSLGFSASPTYAQADLNRGILVNGDQASFEGDGFGWGAGAGIQWAPVAGHTFGLHYRHWSPVEFEGTATTQLVIPAPGVVSEDSSVEAPFPDQIVFGYAWEPTDRLLFEVDVFWANWSRFDTLNFQQASGNIAEAFNWKNTWKVGTGATYKLNDRWKVSGGYWFAEEVGPDSTFNPRLADVALHILSLGATHQGEKWETAIAYQLGIGEDRTVTGSTPAFPSGATANGTYSYLGNGVTISLSRPF